MKQSNLKEALQNFKKATILLDEYWEKAGASDLSDERYPFKDQFNQFKDNTISWVEDSVDLINDDAINLNDADADGSYLKGETKYVLLGRTACQTYRNEGVRHLIGTSVLIHKHCALRDDLGEFLQIVSSAGDSIVLSQDEYDMISKVMEPAHS